MTFKKYDKVIRKGGLSKDIGTVIEPIYIEEGLTLVRFDGGDAVESTSELRLVESK